MGQPPLNPAVLALVADRLKVLAEPVRLEILDCLRERERTVSEIVRRTGLGQANVSRHLQVLHTHELVSRRKDGQFVFYGLADRRVFELCALVCDSLDEAATSRRELLAV